MQDKLPQEHFVYFGDTAHLPYGDKSREAVAQFGRKITEFLLAKDCKCIVIACNTASAYAYKHITNDHPEVPVFNVIDPMVDEIVSNHKGEKIGVIGTKGTISSRVYVRKIHQRNKSVNVTSKATPLLAPMIEEGYFDNYISRTIIESYLDGKNFADIDSLVLACTHYPLIKQEIGQYFEGRVSLLDSAEVVAEEVKTRLTKLSMLHRGKKQANQFFVSDLTNSFKKSAEMFFSEKIELKKFDLWS